MGEVWHPPRFGSRALRVGGVPPRPAERVGMTFRRRSAVLLVALAAGLALWAALLWADAGTRHSESSPSSAVLTAGGDDAVGPDRRPAQVAWAGAIGLALTAVVFARRPD